MECVSESSFLYVSIGHLAFSSVQGLDQLVGEMTVAPAAQCSSVFTNYVSGVESKTEAWCGWTRWTETVRLRFFSYCWTLLAKTTKTKYIRGGGKTFIYKDRRLFLYRYTHKHTQLPKQTDAQKERAAGRAVYPTQLNVRMKGLKKQGSTHRGIVPRVKR